MGVANKQDLRMVPRVGADGSGGGGGVPVPGDGFVFSNGVDRISDLSALDDTLLNNGTVIGVSANLSVGAPFMLNKTSTVAIDGITVAATLSGTGRWERDLGWANPQFGKQGVWELDSSAGDDENTGLAGFPLKTTDELNRRLAEQYLNQVTTITFASGLFPGGIIRLNIGSRGQILFQGTPTDNYVSDPAGFTNVVNINHAAQDGAGGIEDTNLPGSMLALVGQRIRVTSGASIGAQSWIVTDLSATQARVAAWIQMGSAFPFAGFYIPVPVAIGDTYVTEDLTTFSSLHLIISVNQGLPSTAFPHLVVQNIQVGTGVPPNGACQIETDTFDVDVIAFNGCYLSSLEFTGGGSFYNCRIPGPVQKGGGVAFYSSCFIDGSLPFSSPGAFQASSVVIDGDTLIQGAGGFDAFASCTWGAAGAYDSSDAGVIVHPGAAISIEDQYLGIGVAMYGIGNTTYGIRTVSGGSVVYNPTKPTITGTINDTLVGGVAHAYATIPAVTALQLSMIVQKT